MQVHQRERFRLNPFGTVAAGAAVVLGTLGAVFGDGVSAGMTLSLHTTASVMAHLWGIMFATGGALKLYGLYSGRSTVEIPGLWMMTGGYAFYAITVVTGLGKGGLAAGILATALTIGCLFKVHIIMRRAKAAARHHDAETGE